MYRGQANETYECPKRHALRDAEELTGPDQKDRDQGDVKRFLSDRERYDGDGHNHVHKIRYQNNLNLKSGAKSKKKDGHGNKRYRRRDPQEEQQKRERELEKEAQQEANFTSGEDQSDSDSGWYTKYQPTGDDPSPRERQWRRRESSQSSNDLYTQTDERTARDHDRQINQEYAPRTKARLLSFRNSRGSNERQDSPQSDEQTESGKRKMYTRRRVEPDWDEVTNRGARRARRSARLYYVNPPQDEHLQAELDETDSDGHQIHFNRADHRNPRVRLGSREEAEEMRAGRR